MFAVMEAISIDLIQGCRLDLGEFATIGRTSPVPLPPERWTVSLILYLTAFPDSLRASIQLALTERAVSEG